MNYSAQSLLLFISILLHTYSNIFLLFYPADRMHDASIVIVHNNTEKLILLPASNANFQSVVTIVSKSLKFTHQNRLK